MTRAAGYILIPPEGRREILLDPPTSYRSSTPLVAEPVPSFDHSRNAPLIVFLSFEDGKVTHIADGRKGVNAGTGLVRLNLTNVAALPTPIPFEAIAVQLAPRTTPHFEKRATAGGLLPPKTFAAVVDVLIKYDDGLRSRLGRFSRTRFNVIKELSSTARQNLAMQKETVATALKLTGLDSREVTNWSPSGGHPRSFLDDLPEATVREDSMLATDFSNLPGYEALGDATHVAGKKFVSPNDARKSVTVVLANRLPLEEQTGADLIYYNEQFKAFIMVQYKAMKRSGETDVFRWSAGDQLSIEIERMDALLNEITKLPDDPAPDSFRLNSNPFFLKFCPKLVFNPDDGGLFKGFYLPLDYWKRIDATGSAKGPKGGNALGYHNVGRYLTNSHFVSYLENGWIGTTIPQSQSLVKLIRSVLESGRAVAYAVKHPPPPDPDSSEAYEPIWIDDEEDGHVEIRL